jgi:hypothetical protein
MHERDRIKLLFGPYRMPVCKVGRKLRCRIRARQTGTVDLQRRGMPDHIDDAARQKAIAATQRPERNAKIAAARRGKPRPRHVIEAVIKANTGRKLSAEHRRQMSEAHKRNGRRPGMSLTADEEALLGTMTDADPAERMGRTPSAVAAMRERMGIAPFTKRAPRGKPITWTPAKERLLGTMSDVDLARRLRCSAMTVFYRRRRLKIPPFRG